MNKITAKAILGELLEAYEACEHGDYFYDHGDSVCNAVECILKEQDTKHSEAVTKWISVEERLPEPFVSVLVHMPEERPLPTVHEGFLAREGMWYANHFDREPGEVTHWMPLPEPPEVEV